MISKLKECDKVRLLNDNFRTTFIGGQVLLSYGVSELPIDIKARALLTVKTFKDFTSGNDPYGEHDFGSFELADDTFYWKIDLYEEPDVKSANGERVVTRVLTIMLAEEY